MMIMTFGWLSFVAICFAIWLNTKSGKKWIEDL